MDARDVLIDAATRPAQAARALESKLSQEVLNGHLGGHDNSVAWLLWHTGREIDAQLADLAGQPEAWDRFKDGLGLGDAGAAEGYGHTPAQARAIRVDDAGPLLDYIDAVTADLVDYLHGLADDDLDTVIDASWDPPTTRGVRLVSIIDDAAQHIGQAAYVVGAFSQN